MNVEELIGRLRADPGRVLPFVGSGMTVEAGAPSATSLALELARRAGVSVGAPATLSEVSTAAEGAVGKLVVQEHLAEVITGLRLRPTPALTALCGASGGRVLTTNYDDAIERSAASRGLEPVPLLPTDVRMLEVPQSGELQVVHLHGMPGVPSSLVLPGRTTNELVSNSVFERFLSATMAPSDVLYLGFSFGMAELHLRSLLAWLSTEVEDAGEHYLLLPDEEVRMRKDDMALFAGFGFVDVVAYEADARHSVVERVAITLAPRAPRSDEGSMPWRTQPTWVQPVMVRAEPGEGREHMQQRIAGFDFGWAGAEALAGPEKVLEVARAIVIAAPGMGKSTLIRWLPAMVEEGEAAERLCAHGELGDFAPARPGAPVEDGIARLLRLNDGERIAIEDLLGGDTVLLLDGLDEVDEEVRDQAAAAISAAVSRWPGHTWVVTSRPSDAAEALVTDGFESFHILPSRRWARKYLETRSVPQYRVERAMLDGYGLGDLLGVPLFAERLADRLLDGVQDSVSPLELLVDEQYAATRREARRRGRATVDLSGWMRSLAVALEVRGRSSASTDELAAVLGPGGLAASEARRRLVEVALLADAPGVVAFPLKTLQEGLCAEAILSANDLVAVFRYIAVAEVGGSERLRDDLDFTIDLVFEHADRDVRQALKQLDPLRWARTVLTRGDPTDAREAFELLWQWHAELDIGFGGFGESGLRTSGQAIVAIVGCWPELILERRDELEHQARSGFPPARARALTILGQLPVDEKTDDWLLPRLKDPEPQVAIVAAQIAGRLCLTSAEGLLRDLLDLANEQPTNAAISALIEIVDVPSLAEIGARAATRNGLQPVAERLLERLDVDTGIAMITRSGNIDGALPSLVQRLVETAHTDAWTPKRVAALMVACRQLGFGSMHDRDLLASVFARHLDAALAVVHLQPILGGPYGPAGQLLPLSRLDPALLAGDEHVELREAIDRSVREEADWHARTKQHEHHLQRLQTLLDERGLTLEPSDLDPPYGSLRTLAPRHRELLGELTNLWWPETGIRVTVDGDLDQGTRIMLLVAAEVTAPLNAARWLELLDTHLAAPRFGQFELAGDGVTSWLIATYDTDYEEEIASRISDAADAALLCKLTVIPGRDGRTPRLVGLALDRLAALSEETAGWLSVVGVLVQDGHTDEVRALLETDISESARQGILARLATHADPLARVTVIDELTAAVENGLSPSRPQWHEFASTPDVISAAMRLLDAALTHSVAELRDFAFALIQSRPTSRPCTTSQSSRT